MVVKLGHTAVADQAVLGADRLPHLVGRGQGEWEELGIKGVKSYRNVPNMLCKTLQCQTVPARKAEVWSVEDGGECSGERCRYPAPPPATPTSLASCRLSALGMKPGSAQTVLQ